jgi:hypothetical protein
MFSQLGILNQMKEKRDEDVESLRPENIVKQQYPVDHEKLQQYVLSLKKKGLARIINDEAKQEGVESPIHGLRLRREK